MPPLAGDAITWDGSEIGTKGATVKKESGGSPASGRATVRKLPSTTPERASVEISLVDQHGEPFAIEPF